MFTRFSPGFHQVFLENTPAIWTRNGSKHFWMSSKVWPRKDGKVSTSSLVNHGLLGNTTLNKTMVNGFRKTFINYSSWVYWVYKLQMVSWLSFICPSFFCEASPVVAAPVSRAPAGRRWRSTCRRAPGWQRADRGPDPAMVIGWMDGPVLMIIIMIRIDIISP